MKSHSQRDLRSNPEDFLVTDVCDHGMEKYDGK